MVFSNIDLLKEIHFQSKTHTFVDTCLQAKNGCIYVHWTVLLAAGNDWLVDVGDDSIQTIIFPDHSSLLTIMENALKIFHFIFTTVSKNQEKYKSDT